MKKIIAVLLTLIIAFSLPVISFADTNSTALANEKRVLFQLGFLDNTEMDLNGIMTRGEFTKALTEFLNIDYNGTDVEFSDINIYHDYYKVMAAAYKYGLIAGPEARPDNNITYNEAIKMLVCMLGYGQYANATGGYPTGYMAVAQKIRLLNGVQVFGDGNLVNSAFIKLLFNSLSADVMEISAIGQGATYNTVKGKTILSQIYGIETAKGLVEGINGKVIYSGVSVNENSVRISGNTYKIEIDDIKDYVGMNIIYYYSDDTNEVVAFYGKDNAELVIDAEDIYSFSNMKIGYDSGDVNNEYAELSPSAIILYNDEVMTRFDESLFKNQQGRFTLVDNNKDSKYDVVFLDVTDDYVVKLADSTTGNVYDLYTGKYICLSPKGAGVEASFKDEFGNDMYLSELIRYDVISVRKSLDGKKVKAVFSNREVRGTIEEKEISGDNLFVKINGKVYKTTTAFKENETVNVGESGVFVLTTLGKIASINRAFTSETMSVGYLVDGKCNSEFRKEYQLKILTASNKMITPYLAERITIDGISKKKENVFAELSGGGEVDSQIIKFSLNPSGEISRIDTLRTTDDEGNDAIHEMYTYQRIDSAAQKGLVWRSALGILGYKIAADSKTVLFFVPESKSSEDDDYRATNTSWLKNGTNYPSNDGETMTAYRTLDESHIADVIVFKGGDAGAKDTSNEDISVVRDVTEILVDDVEVVKKLYLIEGSNEVEYIVKDDKVLNNVKDFDDPSQVHNLVCGDVVRDVKDEKGRIIDIDLVYDRAKEKIDQNDNQTTKTPNQEHWLISGEIYSMYMSNIYLSKDRITGEMSIDDLVCLNASLFSVIVYDSSEQDNKLKRGSLSDLVDYKTAGEGSKVVLKTTSYASKGTIVVYK